MSKSVLLAAAAVLALSAGGASAAHKVSLSGKATAQSKIHHWSKGVNRAATTLYDQNDDSQGYADVSQNFESSFDAYDAQAADDFTVPSGAKWRVTEVDTTGLYFGSGSGPAASVSVTFYKDKKGHPGKVLASFPEASYTDVGFGSFVVDLGKGAKLSKGHKWVSVVANMDFISTGGSEWGWATRNTQAGDPAQWQNPGGGFGTGCESWSEEQSCLGGLAGIDHMFAIRGKSK